MSAYLPTLTDDLFTPWKPAPVPPLGLFSYYCWINWLFTNLFMAGSSTSQNSEVFLSFSCLTVVSNFTFIRPDYYKYSFIFIFKLALVFGYELLFYKNGPLAVLNAWSGTLRGESPVTCDYFETVFIYMVVPICYLLSVSTSGLTVPSLTVPVVLIVSYWIVLTVLLLHSSKALLCAKERSIGVTVAFVPNFVVFFCLPLGGIINFLAV